MITSLLILLLAVLNLFLLITFRKEKRRNRVLQSFVAGIIRSVSDYHSRTDEIQSAQDLSQLLTRKFPLPYWDILQNVANEFAKDFWVKPFGRWIANDRNLFYDGKYSNDGFNMMYWDLFDKALRDHAGTATQPISK
jgi:hypothetical protein